VAKGQHSVKLTISKRLLATAQVGGPIVAPMFRYGTGPDHNPHPQARND